MWLQVVLRFFLIVIFSISSKCPVRLRLSLKIKKIFFMLSFFTLIIFSNYTITYGVIIPIEKASIQKYTELNICPTHTHKLVISLLNLFSALPYMYIHLHTYCLFFHNRSYIYCSAICSFFNSISIFHNSLVVLDRCFNVSTFRDISFWHSTFYYSYNLLNHP